MRSKKKKHNKIRHEAIDPEEFGYAHRRHRTNDKKTGKRRNLNYKKQKIERLKEEETWEDYKKLTNIIRNEA